MGQSQNSAIGDMVEPGEASGSPDGPLVGPMASVLWVIRLSGGAKYSSPDSLPGAGHQGRAHFRQVCIVFPPGTWSAGLGAPRKSFTPVQAQLRAGVAFAKVGHSVHPMQNGPGCEAWLCLVHRF